MIPTDQPPDHLLRTFASVPVQNRVLDVGCGHGVRIEALVRLGFDVYACDPSPEAVAAARERLGELLEAGELEKRVTMARGDATGYPDECYDWVIAYNTLARYGSRESVLEALAELRRVLIAGGWLYLAVPAVPEDVPRSDAGGFAGDSAPLPTFTPRTLDEVMVETGYVEAEAAAMVTEDDRRLVRAIYRKEPSPRTA